MQTARSWLRAGSQCRGKGASGRAWPAAPRSDAPKATQVRAVINPIGEDAGLWSRGVFNIGRRARFQPQARALPDTPWPDAPKGTKVTAAVIFPVVVAHQGSGCGVLHQNQRASLLLLPLLLEGSLGLLLYEPRQGTRQQKARQRLQGRQGTLQWSRFAYGTRNYYYTQCTIARFLSVRNRTRDTAS